MERMQGCGGGVSRQSKHKTHSHPRPSPHVELVSGGGDLVVRLPGAHEGTAGDEGATEVVVPQRPGGAIIHSGELPHAAAPIASGNEERFNLVRDAGVGVS